MAGSCALQSARTSLVQAKEELEEEILLIQSSRLWGSCPSIRLPKDWQPDILPKKVVMYKLVAAVGTKLVSVYVVLFPLPHSQRLPNPKSFVSL